MALYSRGFVFALLGLPATWALQVSQQRGDAQELDLGFAETLEMDESVPRYLYGGRQAPETFQDQMNAKARGFPSVAAMTAYMNTLPAAPLGWSYLPGKPMKEGWYTDKSFIDGSWSMEQVEDARIAAKGQNKTLVKTGHKEVAHKPLTHSERVAKKHRHQFKDPKADGNYEQEFRTIPDIVHMTGPFKADDVIAQNRLYVNQGTEFRFYSNYQMAASVKNISEKLEEHGIHGAFAAFNSLRPVAFKTDLWRYMVLWDVGGIYLDAKLRLRSHVNTWLKPAKADKEGKAGINTCDDLTVKYWNAVMSSPPRHPDMLKVINHVVKNLQHHWYGNSTSRLNAARHTGLDHEALVASAKAGPIFGLMITGPGALSETLTLAAKLPHSNCKLLGGPVSKVAEDGFAAAKPWYLWSRLISSDAMTQRNPMTGMAEPVVLADLDDSVHEQMHSADGLAGLSYNDLWKARAVYCDDKPIPFLKNFKNVTVKPCEDFLKDDTSSAGRSLYASHTV